MSTQPNTEPSFNDLERYHKLTLLVANLVPAGVSRPMHLANTTKIPLGALTHLFEPLDDGTISLIPNARTVGAAAHRKEGAEEGDALPRVVVI